MILTGGQLNLIGLPLQLLTWALSAVLSLMLRPSADASLAEKQIFCEILALNAKYIKCSKYDKV